MEFAEYIGIPKVDGVIMYRGANDAVEGTLCVTGHHLILSSRQTNTEELWLLHRNVDSVERSIVDNKGSIILRCKDFEMVRLDIQSTEECLKVVQSIEALSNIDNIKLMYPFFYRPMFILLEDGWQMFTPETEFNRIKSYSDNCRVSHVNKDYKVCRTYPESVMVPKSISDETLIEVSKFRQGGRFAIVSYIHKLNGTTLLRSSQPLVGPTSKRCRGDAELLNAVLGSGRRGYIIDTRAPNIMKLAQARGGGTEPEMHYSQWKRITLSIERHTVLQESLGKLFDAGSDVAASTDRWLSRLESSGWLSHIKDVLTGACVTAQCLDRDGACVLVHGTDGTDSTLQLTSLAQILLDPDCRTLRGFEALIEREWLQAGHPFQDRCCKAISTHRSKSSSPVFLLFIDCAWQIWQQYPLSFEFNEDFLKQIFRHAYASQFGTFLANCDSERKQLDLQKNTISLWSYVSKPEHLSKWLNPLYEPNNDVLWPSVAPLSIKVWYSVYCPWQPTEQPMVWDKVKDIKSKHTQARIRAIKLRKQLVRLEKEAIEQGLLPPPTARAPTTE